MCFSQTEAKGNFRLPPTVNNARQNKIACICRPRVNCVMAVNLIGRHVNQSKKGGGRNFEEEFGRPLSVRTKRN